ncbi:MAG TPA: 3-oxoacyl-[acyl-carrier-protein] synthase III C-terminal domain-containing protein, partial [Spirochaetia bacterium]|nr:3-oxoacyl-[acyl-carrier-protein] synthase III C-terminal domain-containing protein [Spirochaetia bacterium]
ALGSANYPYSEKVMSGTVASALGLRPNIVCVEAGGSTLAGTQALLMALELLEKKERRLALVLVADNPAAQPADDIEHGLGAASCAFLLGKENVAVRVEGWTSQVRESLGTRFRRSGEASVRDLGIKTLSSDAYAGTIGPAVKELTSGLGTDPGQYRHVVFSQPGARLTLSLGRSLGFSPEQMETGLLYKETGDTGACSALLGLCAVLDQVEAGERILLAGFGAGAGAQAASLVVGGKPQGSGPTIRQCLDRKTYIDYVQYLKIRGHIL